MKYEPVNVSASKELGRKLAQLQAHVAALQRQQNYVTLSADLAGITDAITLLKACVVENFGEDRMAILDKLESLEQQVAQIETDVSNQSGTLTALSNQVNAVSLQAQRAGWRLARYPTISLQQFLDSDSDYRSPTSYAVFGSTSNYRAMVNNNRAIRSPAMIIKEMILHFQAAADFTAGWMGINTSVPVAEAKNPTGTWPYMINLADIPRYATDNAAVKYYRLRLPLSLATHMQASTLFYYFKSSPGIPSQSVYATGRADPWGLSEVLSLWNSTNQHAVATYAPILEVAYIWDGE